MKRVIVAVCLGVVAIGAEADVSVIGGSSTCGQWVANRDIKAPVLEGWMVGYISGIAMGRGEDILRGVDWKSVSLWVDKHCRENPLDDMVAIGLALYTELVIRRSERAATKKK